MTRLFEFAPAWYRERCGAQRLPVTDLARDVAGGLVEAMGVSNAVPWWRGVIRLHWNTTPSACCCRPLCCAGIGRRGRAGQCADPPPGPAHGRVATEADMEKAVERLLATRGGAINRLR